MRTRALCGLAIVALGATLTVRAAQPVTAATAVAPVVSLARPSPTGHIEATLAPGRRSSTTIVVTNAGTAAAVFLVTPVDGYTANTGGILYGDRQAPFHTGQPANGEYGAGRWISVSVGQLHLNPRQSQRLTVTAGVPQGTAPGDWVGGVTVENPAADAGQAAIAPANGAAPLKTVMEVIIHVPGATTRGGVFISAPVVMTQTPQQVVEVPLSYTGDVLAKPTYSFTITDSLRHVVFAIAGRFDTFVPHSAITDALRVVPALTAGTYNFAGVAGPDGDSLAAQYPMAVSALPLAAPGPAVGAPSPPAQVSGNVPERAIAVILLLAALIVFVIFMWQRARCSHCRRGGLGGLITLSGYDELAHCSDCRLRALQRQTVRLCLECYRRHSSLREEAGVVLAGRAASVTARTGVSQPR